MTRSAAIAPTRSRSSMNQRIKETIGQLLTDAMDKAVENGANSVSMPDEYVELAAWLSADTGVTPRKHSHYFKDVSHLKDIDVYRVLKLFNVTDPCVQHAVKKLLAAGGRGAGKDIERDLREAVDSINRALQMIAEDDV